MTLPPGPIEARDEARHDRVAGADKDNRNLCGCRLCYRGRRGIRGDDSHFVTYKIGRQDLEAFVVPLCPLVIHRNVFALDVTAFIEPMEESGQVRRVSFW